MVEPQLGFEDNLIFFCQHHISKSLTTIKGILCEFTQFMCLQFNCGKSFVTFSKRVNDGDELAGILGFQLKSLPIMYLGVPLTCKSISHKDCHDLISDL